MYHCHLHYYLAGGRSRIFEVIKEMPPLTHFTHEFSESERPEREPASKADVIFADLRGRDTAGEAKALISSKREDAELIVLTEKEQVALLEDCLSDIRDIWTLPMSDEEIRFRFLRWQQGCKMSRDYWETSQYLESTINNIPNLIWFKDKGGVHEKVNDSFCRTVEKTKKQVEGRRHAYIWNVEFDDPVCIESEEEVMRTGKTLISEETIETGMGQRTLTTYKSPLYNVDGTVMGTVGVGIDITQERAYEREIIRKNQTLEMIFTSIDCGVMLHSVDGRHIRSINRAALKILGYESRKELEADGFQMIANSVVEEDRARLVECITALKEKGDSVSVEYRVRHKDGEELHVMGNIKLLEEDGELFYQRFLLDCTAQKLQEKRKERHQAELIHALSEDYDLVWYFDLDSGSGRLLRNDGPTGRFFPSDFSENVSFGESLARYIDTVVHKDDRDMLRTAFTLERLKEELAEKKQYYVNYRICLEDKILYFQVKAVRAGEWDKNHGIVLGCRSVDEEIRSELEKKELLENALLQANRANKAKSVFLSNMSHDIRTPMNAIVGFTALAMTHIDQREQVEEYLEKIMTSGNHLLSLINDVLDMSRIESGKMHLEENECHLPDILHGLRNILQADVHAKRLELYMDAVDVMDEDIYCDKLRLNQVLLNLLSNAVKYTGAGGVVSIRVTEKPGAPEGYGNYEFLIKDTGIGMSEEFVAHIFEPFERETSSTINKIQGTGLGMAITKNIVDMMNGSIEVKSKQDVGTEIVVSFTFRLNGGNGEPQEIPKLKNCRALVVDDDFNTCDSVSYMLEQVGMRAEWTLSGKEAILRTRQAMSRKDNYSVYIIDWLLPDMNGVEVTRRIRKEIGDDVPVIVLTAYDWTDIESEAKEAGVTAFCSKPLFLSELRKCLCTVVAKEEEEEQEKRERGARRYTGRILLAEDNELNQEIAAAILGDAGFTTEIANNGEEAVNMLKNSRPGYYQLILMDVRMPVMDGYEAARKIRGLDNKELASIPILAMTANAFEEDKREALSNGMNGHLAKPIDIDALLDTLDRVLA